MAVQLEPDVRRALSGDMTPKFLATLDAEGRPNCVPVITITPYEDGTLVFGEFFMNKSRRNLLENPNVGVAVFTDGFDGWSLKGTFLGFETTGERIDWINSLPMFRYNAYTSVRAAGTIRVESVSGKFHLSKSRFLRGFLWASAVAPFAALERNGPRRMPRRVAQKFRRLSAVRAAAFRDADGFPRAFPVMACVPAGPNRLLVDDPVFSAYERDMAVGACVAASVITTDPVAYQVKGEYRGRRSGVGVIDLTACYSASPPLLGERLDTP